MSNRQGKNAILEKESNFKILQFHSQISQHGNEALKKRDCDPHVFFMPLSSREILYHHAKSNSPFIIDIHINTVLGLL